MDHCNAFMKGDGALSPGHDDNHLRSLIVRIWSIVQVQAEKSAFSTLARVVSERKVGETMVVHLKLVLGHLWIYMIMIDANRVIIPESEVTFAGGFGWIEETEALLGSAQQLSGKDRSAVVKAFIKDMFDRGITIRHQTAHAVRTDQVDSDPFKRRHSLRQSTRATEHAPSTHQS